MTIWERVEQALSILSIPVAANTYTGATLPDAFAVYQMISDPPVQHADDRETLTRYRVQVTVYRRAGLAGMPDVKDAMLDAGFTRGPSRELPYNTQTRHYALAMDFFYLEEQE